jgi:nucleoside-diphosphate-sugar epimerase
MARVLIVGCGCRGQKLAQRLLADGHAVRATTRDPGRAPEIAATGAEVWIGDPARLATLSRALEAVTVVYWLLASARGDRDGIAALHHERLRSYLREMVDTTVRGFVYEAVGTAGPEVLRRGRAIVEEARVAWEIPVVILEADPADVTTWVGAARSAAESLLGDRRRQAGAGLG